MAVGGSVLADVEAAVRAAFDDEPARATVSFLGVEPLEVLRFGEAELRSYVTLGMSRRPMTAADALVEATDGPRAELLLQARVGQIDTDATLRQLAVMAAAPAVEGIVHVDGATVDLGMPLAPDSTCTGAVLVTSALPPVQTDSGPVEILRVLPATPAELAWSRARGSEALRQRWDEAGTDLLDLARAAVAFE